MIASTITGNKIIYGCVVKDLKASLIREPREARGWGTPRPIKARKASVKMALGMENIDITIN